MASSVWRNISIILLLLLIQGCRTQASSGAANDLRANKPCAIALAKMAANQDQETRKIDAEIERLQKRAETESTPGPYIERLGWAYVEKARLTYDPGFYKLAEQCAECLTAIAPQSADAILLRGHILHNLHRFKDAETYAMKLVAKRGRSFDYGLLGDVLMEQGKLDQAVDAYQKMIDQKPNLQSYSRAAHVRWLRGDLDGAIELMKMAVSAASPADPVSAAWAYARSAQYQFQAGQSAEAMRSCRAAANIRKDFVPGLAVCSRILISEGKFTEAVELQKRAVALDPLPEYQWALADALRSADRNDEAAKVEMQLERSGEKSDPRTYSLFLSTRARQPEKALQLAKEELNNRADIFTYDALAWAQSAAGRHDEAYKNIRRALSEGTVDGRLYLHAAVISARSGDLHGAAEYADKAGKLQHTLLPGEREILRRLRIHSS